MGMIVRSPTTAETSPVRLSIVARIYSAMSEGSIEASSSMRT
jgi:hypothetical protein